MRLNEENYIIFYLDAVLKPNTDLIYKCVTNTHFILIYSTFVEWIKEGVFFNNGESSVMKNLLYTYVTKQINQMLKRFTYINISTYLLFYLSFNNWI